MCLGGVEEYMIHKSLSATLLADDILSIGRPTPEDAGASKPVNTAIHSHEEIMLLVTVYQRELTEIQGLKTEPQK